MCGICGFFNLGGGPVDQTSVLAMRERLAHRGPDDQGEYFSGSIGLGFQRLSILDLEGGHQPMQSQDGNLAIVFNGEIYNHPLIQKSLLAQGIRYKTRSDTETILHLYHQQGARAFGRLRGMFAIGLWDLREQELVLARDPMGIKPLYYLRDGERFLFASEVRALAAGAGRADLDPESVCDYLTSGYVHSPRTIFKNVFKLLPGHLLRVRAEGCNLEKFWDIPAKDGQVLGDTHQALERLEVLLRDCVRSQMLSDVPLGAFLSGGVDSSLVTAFMAEETSKPVETFTIGFEGAQPGIDESSYAREVSRHLGTNHHELKLPADVLNRMDRLIFAMDEPIADSAILPTYLLAQFAKKSVSVVLTGEGADELFAGYERYKAAFVSEKLKGLPALLQAAGAAVARGIGRGKAFEKVPIRSIRQWAEASLHSTRQDLAAIFNRDFLNSVSQKDRMEWLPSIASPPDFNQILAFDLRTVLCDSLLMKVDKSTMRTGLEARVPFLDTEMVAFAMGLAPELKVKRFKGKYLLRRLAKKRLPSSIANRRKHGFVVPWEEWILSPKNELPQEAIRSPALRREGLFDSERLASLLSEVRQGHRRVDPGLLYRVVVLGLWLESLRH